MKMRKGFTLVELLVVIIIIGILAAMAMLASGSAQDSAQATTIVSDLRSLKLLFVADHVGSTDTELLGSDCLGGGITKIAEYMDDSDKTNGKFKSGGDYTIAISSSKVYVGYGKTDGSSLTKGVKDKLAAMAARVELKATAATDTAKANILF